MIHFKTFIRSPECDYLPVSLEVITKRILKIHIGKTATTLSKIIFKYTYKKVILQTPILG